MAAGCPAAISASPVTAAAGFRREGPLQALGKILAVIAPHHLVADAASDFTDALFERRAPFRRGKAAAFDFARPDHFGKAPRSPDDFLDRSTPTGAREIVGVLPLGQQREAKTFSRQ